MLTKAQELLYYLIKHNGGVDDKTKLAKLGYFSDFIHFAFHDKPIAEESVYRKQRQGPLTRTFTDDLEALKNAGLIEESPKYNYTATDKKHKTDFSEEEKKTLDFVIKKYGHLSYKDLVAISHSQPPYLSSRDGEIVEFFTAYNLVDEYEDYAIPA